MDSHRPPTRSSQISNFSFPRLTCLGQSLSKCRHCSERVADALIDGLIAFGVCTACFVCDTLLSSGDDCWACDTAL